MRDDEIRLISSQDDRAKRKQHSMRIIESHLRRLFANLLRVHRGAGKDYEIFHQLVELAQELCAHVNEFDNELSEFDLAKAIRIDEAPRGLTPEARRWENGIEQIMNGAAQMIASRLLGQNSSESAGSREMFNGLS